MRNNPVVLICFEEQDNLGIGYIASILLQNDIQVKIIDFRIGKENILQHLKDYRPLIVGFSIIFQYYVYEFKNLIAYLRKHGIKCHFCAGGHYPSLRYLDLFEVIPEIDSIVLFEGEHTFLELVSTLYSGNLWQNITGIAYKNNGSVITNPFRPLEKDLDNFPVPVRQPLRDYALKKKYATILAGRGCLYNCSFCSIREFYSKPEGPLKRMRRPEMVVSEIELLRNQLGCSIFMFQDDDFPISTNQEKKWAVKFCELLSEKQLTDKILWKINCRPDEVDKDIFKMMKSCGLFLVYLGIEDGTDDGLKLMNKHIDKETTINTVGILKELGIQYDFGFMLFNPWSTYQTVLDNLKFLETICGDGSSPITFCKMLPYAETKIEYILKKERRLKGKFGFEDYDFIDFSLNQFYFFISECFNDWMSDHEGLLNTARWAGYYLVIYKKYHPITPAFTEVEKTTKELISQSNIFFIDAMKKIIDIFNSNDDNGNNLIKIKRNIDRCHSHFKNKFAEATSTIENIAFSNTESFLTNHSSGRRGLERSGSPRRL